MLEMALDIGGTCTDVVCLHDQRRVSHHAIVEPPDTTTVVYPGQRCRIDAAGNLRIRELAPA